MPAEGDTITFEVSRKTVSNAVEIDSSGNPITVEITTITMIPLNEGQSHVSVAGSIIINTKEPDLYALGAKYDATFTDYVPPVTPPVV